MNLIYRRQHSIFATRFARLTLDAVIKQLSLIGAEGGGKGGDGNQAKETFFIIAKLSEAKLNQMNYISKEKETFFIIAS